MILNIYVALLAAVVAGFGSWRLLTTLRLRRNGLFILATVSAIKRRGRGYSVFVRFKTRKGKRVVANVPVMIVMQPNGLGSRIYSKGDTVPILYDPRHPQTVVEYTFDGMWMVPLGLFGISAIMLFLAFTTV